MNAIDLLKEDHDKVDKLFQKVKATKDQDHTDLFEQIKHELEVHTHVEETLFYPRLIADGDEKLQKKTKEGIQEHHQAKMFLRELSNLADESEKFEPKLKVLMDDIGHHVQEEEGELFPMVKEQFDEYTLQMLGDDIEKEKKSFGKSKSASTAK